MSHVRKKWIVVLYLNVDGYLPENVQTFVEAARSSFGENQLEKFFETETLAFFVPIRDYPTRMEVHEIILDAVGYDKYEAVVKNTNLEVQAVLDQLKELIDVEK